MCIHTGIGRAVHEVTGFKPSSSWRANAHHKVVQYTCKAFHASQDQLKKQRALVVCVAAALCRLLNLVRATSLLRVWCDSVQYCVRLVPLYCVLGVRAFCNYTANSVFLCVFICL